MKRIILILLAIFTQTYYLAAQTTDEPPKMLNSLETLDASAPIEDVVYKIEQSNLEKEIILNGQDVILSGSNNKITIKGIVGKIHITGKDNDVFIETVNHIAVSGNGNFVSWEKSSNTNGKPVVSDKGGYNNIDKRSSNAIGR